MERERVAGQASRAALLRAAVLSTSRVCPGWAGYVGFRPRETGVRRSAGRAGRERRHWRGPVLGQTGASCCGGRGARVVFQGGGAPPREQAGFSFKHGAESHSAALCTQRGSEAELKCHVPDAQASPRGLRGSPVPRASLASPGSILPSFLVIFCSSMLPNFLLREAEKAPHGLPPVPCCRQVGRCPLSVPSSWLHIWRLEIWNPGGRFMWSTEWLHLFLNSLSSSDSFT